MNPVIMFEIASDDPDASKTFYRELFGWELSETGNGYAAIDFGSTELGVGGLMGPRPIPGDAGVKIIVRVDDLEATLSRAEELGGARLFGPSPISPERDVALFTDPDGNPVSIMKFND